MMQVLVIALGGAVGSVLRYFLQKAWNTTLPAGTFAVNILGCFFIGWLLAVSVKGWNEQTKLFLITGFCGGFTTFSAFSAESLQLMLSDRWMIFCLYLVASVAGGLLATFLGYKIFS